MDEALKPRIDSPSPRTAGLPTVQVGGVTLHDLTEAQCIAHVLAELDAGRGGWLVTLNVNHLRTVRCDPAYAALCTQATLTVADGMPLVWASRLQGTALRARVAGSDLLSSLSVAAAGRGRSVFLLGGAPGTADACAAVLRERCPDLRVAGTACPEVTLARIQDDTNELARHLAEAAPDIVFVALGTPKEDFLIETLRSVLPHAWFVGVGISFSFLSGEIRRAPRWMQQAGLEWLHRLRQEPWRLAGRYLLHGAPIAVSLLAGALARRFRPRT